MPEGPPFNDSEKAVNDLANAIETASDDESSFADVQEEVDNTPVGGADSATLEDRWAEKIKEVKDEEELAA